MERKLITIFGATGAQGSGLLRSIQVDPQRRFTARAVTRREHAAERLQREGTQAVVADLDDPASVRAALRDAWGAYCVTNFWEHLSPERELAQARTVAEATAAERVQHVIWSTLEDTRRFVPADGRTLPVLMGRYNVPHFDAKGEADAVFTQTGVPVTFLRTCFYWDNFTRPGMAPAPGTDGRLKLSLPLGRAALPGIASTDIGRCAFGVFADAQRWIGRTVGIAGEHLTGEALARKLAAALGRPVDYAPMAFDEYRALGFAGADDLGNMFEFQALFEREFNAARDPAISRRLNPRLLDFDAWLDRFASSIPTTSMGSA